VNGPEQLEARGLVKRYGGKTVVSGIDLKVRRGEVVGLLGPNGAGKTTTFYMVVGLVRPDGGSVVLGGEDITRLPMYLRARKGVGYLPQEPSLEERKAHFLSGGERRRVEIARALATDPAFILLDEPFAGIDPIAVSDLRDQILHLKTLSIGVILSDHNVRETLAVCDRAYIVSHGSILEEGEPEEVVRSAKARSEYLGEGFRLD
jgi:lipopolysaccharide export system ATP-binding protein